MNPAGILINDNRLLVDRSESLWRFCNLAGSGIGAYGTPLDEELQEYLRRKGTGKTVSTYGAAFRRFMKHYRKKYGADRNIRLFLGESLREHAEAA